MILYEGNSNKFFGREEQNIMCYNFDMSTDRWQDSTSDKS